MKKSKGGIDEGYRPEMSVVFLLRSSGIVFLLSYIYPIVPHALAFLPSFLSLVTVVQSTGPKQTSVIFLLRSTGISLVLSYTYPTVPHAAEFLHSSC